MIAGNGLKDRLHLFFKDRVLEKSARYVFMFLTIALIVSLLLVSVVFFTDVQFDDRFQLFFLSALSFISLTILLAAYSIVRLISQNRSLLQKQENLTEQLHNANEREMLKNRYLSIASHDLRNPLSAVLSFSDLLKEEEDHKTIREYLGYIHQSAETMLHLVSDMLDLQKLEEGNESVQFEQLNVHAILDGLVVNHVAHANRKQIKLALDDTIRKKRFRIDKAVFTQVADNLISNAIKFSPPGSTVDIRLSVQEGNLRLNVKDQGPGIKEDEKARLFKRFEKLSSRPTSGESSTGLGLAIVKEKMDSIGGIILCENNSGEGGSTFTAIFPQDPPSET